MALAVKSGQIVQAVIKIMNVGGVTGEFKLEGGIMKPGSNLYEYLFYTTKGKVTGDPVAWPSAILPPGGIYTFTVYSAIIGAFREGTVAKLSLNQFPDGQKLDGFWLIRQLPSGGLISRKDTEALQYGGQAVSAFEGTAVYTIAA